MRDYSKLPIFACFKKSLYFVLISLLIYSCTAYAAQKLTVTSSNISSFKELSTTAINLWCYTDSQGIDYLALTKEAELSEGNVATIISNPTKRIKKLSKQIRSIRKKAKSASAKKKTKLKKKLQRTKKKRKDFKQNKDACDDSIAQWQQIPLTSTAQKAAGITGGEGMQMIWGISYAPSNSKIVYLVSDTSQVWKSTDSGASWSMKHKGFLANGGISLVVDPTNADIVFVAGSQHDSGTDSLADGIYRTVDGGETWVLLRKTAYCRIDDTKGGVNFAFGGTKTVYAATHSEGLLKSTDGGDNWSKLNVLTSEKILDIKASAQDATLFFLATQSGLYSYQDTGSGTLTKIGSGLSSFPRSIAVDPTNEKVIFVSAGKAGVFKSTDGGNSFSAINNGLDPLTWDDGYAATYLAISPVDPDYLYLSFYRLGGNHPYYTHNGGSSWQAPSIMDKGGLITKVNGDSGGEYWSTPIAPSPSKKQVALTSGAGNHLEITSDGGKTWTFSGSGYTGGRAGTGVSSFSFDPNDANRFALFLIDFGAVLTKDGGATFKNLNVLPGYNDGLTTTVGALDPTKDSKLIVTAAGDWNKQIITVSRDEGQSWTQVEGSEDAYNFIAFSPQNPDIVYANKYRSLDNAKTWGALEKDVAAIYPENGNIVYAAESDGSDITIYKSEDRGTTWTQPYDTIGISENFEIAIDPSNSDRIYVTTGWNGLYIWNGSSWELKTYTDGLEKDKFDSVSTRSIVIDPKHANRVYAGNWISFRGHSNGVFYSNDSGVSWQNITRNLGPEFNVEALAVNPHNGYIFVGSSHGTWKLVSPGD